MPGEEPAVRNRDLSLRGSPPGESERRAPDALRVLSASQHVTDSDRLAKQQGQLIGLVADVLDQREYQRAAMAFANELARLLDCTRVSVGTYRGKRLAVDVLSDTAQFEVKSSLARRLALAMEEACEQGDTILFPAVPKSRHVTRVHEDLAAVNQVRAMCTVPLVTDEEVIGAVLLERTSARPFGAEQVALAEHACLMVAPILQLKCRAEDPLTKRWRAAIVSGASKIVGPQYLAGKLIGVMCACALSALAIIDVEYQVTSTALLEPQEVRAVVSPTRGFVAKVHGRAGDTVTAGTPLAELDQRDLRLELEKQRNELNKKVKESQSALAARDRSRVRVLASQEKQIQAQIRLVESLIDRGQLNAPIDGVIIAANPNYSFGSPVERGEVMFEIAPLTNFNLIMEVDERDIADIHEADLGKLVLKARPQETLPFAVSKITPVSASKDGTTTFRVEAQLRTQPAWLRPGMSGIGKIGVGEHSLLWVWSHRIIEEIVMRWWRWGWL